MKYLSIVRHAKSSWKDPDLPDFERPLNKRGERDGPALGERLAARQARPDHIVSSPALRALRTARLVAASVGYDPGRVHTIEALYLASAAGLLQTIRQFDDAWERVMLFGHNPGLTDLVNLLADCGLENLPTCGVAELELGVSSWRETSPGGARLTELDFPKKGKE